MIEYTYAKDAASIYANCASQNTNSAEGLLLCLTSELVKINEADHDALIRNREFSRNMALIYSAALAFFMQAGFAMVCAGAVRRKNLQNTMLKNVLDACGASIAFYSVGYAFAFGDGSNPNGFIGTTNFFLRDVEDIAFWLYQYAFSAASTTIVAGTLAERCQMAAYFYYSIMLSGFVYPIVAHALWSRHGFLSGDNSDPFLGVGVLDIAGSGVVHCTGGVTALVATYVLGPRRGRFHDEQTGELLAKPKEIKGHNIGLQLLGTLILWFGWYGFNSGSALLADSTGNGDLLATRAGANTTLAAGAAGISSLFTNWLMLVRTTGQGHYDLVITMNGVLAGLVSITSSCGLVEPWAAVITGATAGVLYLLGTWTLVKCRLDDAVDAIPVHLVGGTWGMIATGLFASPARLIQAYGRSDHAGLFYGGVDGGADATLLGAQITGVLFILTWTTGTMFPFFFGLERTGHFRADAIAEVSGLDKAYFGGLQLGGGEEEVAPEQIEMLSKQIEHHLHHRRRQQHPHTTSDKGSISASSRGTGESVISSTEVPTSNSITAKQDLVDRIGDTNDMGNARNV